MRAEKAAEPRRGFFKEERGTENAIQGSVPCCVRVTETVEARIARHRQKGWCWLRVKTNPSYESEDKDWYLRWRWKVGNSLSDCFNT